jgi:hypothetical protein
MSYRMYYNIRINSAYPALITVEVELPKLLKQKKEFLCVAYLDPVLSREIAVVLDVNVTNLICYATFANIY